MTYRQIYRLRCQSMGQAIYYVVRGTPITQEDLRLWPIGLLQVMTIGAPIRVVLTITKCSREYARSILVVGCISQLLLSANYAIACMYAFLLLNGLLAITLMNNGEGLGDVGLIVSQILQHLAAIRAQHSLFFVGICYGLGLVLGLGLTSAEPLEPHCLAAYINGYQRVRQKRIISLHHYLTLQLFIS